MLRQNTPFVMSMHGTSWWINLGADAGVHMRPAGHVRESEVPLFTTILRIVAMLAALSAALAVSVAILNAFVLMPLAADLVHAFIEAFKACLFTILGLLGGHAASGRLH